MVTGGASGIGLALGRALVAAGAHVVLADIAGDDAHRRADELTATAATGGGGGSATGRRLDVTDGDDVRRAVREVVARHGRLDLLVNNAGISLGGPTHELTAAHWDRIIDVNLRGVVNGVLAGYPQMVEQRHGQIVNTASGAGLVGLPFVAAYSATKHAVVGLSSALRPEAALHGVRVSALCPGAVETPILDRPAPPTSRPGLAGGHGPPVPLGGRPVADPGRPVRPPGAPGYRRRPAPDRRAPQRPGAVVRPAPLPRPVPAGRGAAGAPGATPAPPAHRLTAGPHGRPVTRSSLARTRRIE